MPNLTPTRPTQITAAEVQTLNAEAEKTFSIRQKTEGRSVPVKDDLGNIYRYEHELVPVGVEVFFKQNPTAEVMAFVQRPATDVYIGKLLSELTAHKPYARGAEAFAVVIRDMVHDLAGMSHWAVRKVCEQYRQDTSITFFPDTSQFVAAVKKLDEQLRWNGEAEKKAEPEKDSDVKAVEKPSDIQKAKIAKLLHDSGIAHDRTFCEQCKGVT